MQERGPVDGVVVRALELLAGGRTEGALAAVRAPGGGRLRSELAAYLAARHDGRVYDDPAAFRAFIDGGGNVGLYAAIIPCLAAAYRELSARSVLDIGCGDGRAVVPAAATLGTRAPELDLVEPSGALLAAAVTAARERGVTARAHHGRVQDLLAGTPRRRWDLAQATFALHAIPPAERTEVLAALRDRAGALLLVEFDVPAFTDRGPEHLAYLAQRYELGVAEYPEGPVAQGFLMPVLVGQVDPGRTRQTWEQPATAWAGQLRDAGWHAASAQPLAGYWWAPATLVTARTQEPVPSPAP